MMKNQEGSMAIAIMVGMVAIGVATVSVSNSQNVLAFKAKESKVMAQAQEEDTKIISAMAQYKALLAGRRVGNRSIPGLYAANYFDRTPTNWTGMNSSTYVAGSPFEVKSQYSGTVLQAAGSLQTTDRENATRSVNGSYSSPSTSTLNNSYVGAIEKINLATTGAGAGFAIDSATVVIKKGTNVVLRAEVALPVPKPYAPKVVYRLGNREGLSDAWLELKEGTYLPPATYEFNAMGSGVVRQATLIINGRKYSTETKIVPGKGIQRTEKYQWQRDYTVSTAYDANNFEAEDKLLFSQLIKEYLNNDEDFDVGKCKMLNKKAVLTASLSIQGVDDKTGVGALPEEQKVAVEGRVVPSTTNITLDDYKKSCQALCEFVDPIAGETSHDTYVHKYLYAWINKGGSATREPRRGRILPKKLYTGEFMYLEARDPRHVPYFNIQNKILCATWEGRDLDNPVPVNPYTQDQWISHRAYHTVDKTSCKADFLKTRLECGCVAEDTRILLGDGVTEKRIDELTQDDQIWNPLLKKAVGIRYLTRGPEKIPMLTIAVGGKELKVTTQHPFPTHEGMKAASALKVGEEVLIEGLGWQAISELTWVDAGANPPIVWNIYVEAEDGDTDAHHYVANGIITGDLMIQQKLGK